MDKIKQFGGVILIIAGMIIVYSGFDGVRAIFYGKDKSPIKVEENVDQDSIEDENADEVKRIKVIDFTLVDQYGNEHTFRDYEGKTVFVTQYVPGAMDKDTMKYLINGESSVLRK